MAGVEITHTHVHTYIHIHIALLFCTYGLCSRSESTTLSTVIPKDDTKSTLAQDDENNSDQCVKVKCTPKSSPESLSSPSDIAITPTNAKMYRCRFKAKSDHAKYEQVLFFTFSHWNSSSFFHLDGSYSLLNIELYDFVWIHFEMAMNKYLPIFYFLPLDCFPITY